MVQVVHTVAVDTCKFEHKERGFERKAEVGDPGGICIQPSNIIASKY